MANDILQNTVLVNCELSRDTHAYLFKRLIRAKEIAYNKLKIPYTVHNEVTVV